MALKAKESFAGVDISEIRKMNAQARSSTLNLGIGQLPDPLPPALADRAAEALEKGQTRYTSNQGDPSLRELIASYHSEKCGRPIDSSSVIVTNGAEGALWNILFTYLDRGDRILIPEIAFSVYKTIADLQSAESVPYRQNRDFSINFEHLEQQLNKPVKFLIVNSPNNPTGTVLSKEDMIRLVNLAEEKDFYIISDEIYSELYFGDERPFSPLSNSDRVIVVDGISKRAAATGLRIGWTVAQENITRPMIAANQYVTTCASSVSQYAAKASLDGSCDSFVHSVRRDLSEKSLYAWKLLSSIKGVSVVKPQGAFYIFPDISAFGKSKEVAMRILEEADVLTIPGMAFGERGDRHIRISCAVDIDVLKEALERLKNILENWSEV